MPQEKIRVYDKGVTMHPYYETYGDFQLSYRYGDVHIPRIEETEPLKVECEHFVDCITKGLTPRTDGINGLRVVTLLEERRMLRGKSLVEPHPDIPSVCNVCEPRIERCSQTAKKLGKRILASQQVTGRG